MDKFVFYTGWRYLFAPLSQEAKGLLIDAIFNYALSKKRPTFNVIDDPIGTERLTMAFGYISAQIDRDLERQKHISKQRRIAGLKSAEARRRKEHE